MAKASINRGRASARPAAAAPRLTAAAIVLVTDIDKVKARIVKLAKRLDIAVPNTAAETPASASITGAVAGAQAAVAAVHDLLNHVEQAV